MATIPQVQMQLELEGLETMSTSLNMDSLPSKIIHWFDHLSVLQCAEVSIMEDKSFKCQGKKYQCWTPQLVVIRKWHRRCQLLLRAIRQGCWLRVRNLSSKMIRSRMLVEDAYYDPEVEMDISSCFGGVQPLTPPPGGDSELEWSEWIHELEQIVKQLSCKLHGRYRKNQRLKCFEWAQKRDESYKSGKCKEQLRRDLGEPTKGGLLSTVESIPEPYVREDGSEDVRPARIVEEPEQVKELLAANFSQWFGEGRNKWFIGTQIWQQVEGMTLRKK